MEQENNTRDRWLTVDEEQRLLNAAAPWLRELITFAIHTGMRLGEILGLTWAGVDVFRRTVTVFKSKNGERRTIPLNLTALELLKHKSATRQRETDLAFPSQGKTRLDGSNISRGMKRALDRRRSRIFTSTICGIPVLPGWCRLGWTSTRCNGCWGISRRS